MCPICGEKNPFEGVVHDTNDLTVVIEKVNSDPSYTQDYKPKRKLTYALLAMFFGFVAMHLFYVKKTRNMIIWFFMNLAGYAFISLILFFVLDYNYMVFLYVFLGVFVFNLINGIMILCQKDLTDNDGEFLV